MRCVVPPGFFSAGLNGHSDGSLFLSSWIFFILSCAEDDPTKFSSWITGAGAKVKHHSVVGNEMISIYLLMENVTAYVFNHHSSLFSPPPQDFPTKWPHVSIIFYHVASELNCADSNLKIPCDLDPCRIMESQMWRNGLPQMMDPSWPPEQSIFLKVEKGQLIWLGKNKAEPSNCIRCHNTVCGTRSCGCMACAPALLSRNLNTNPSSSLNWPLLLDALPLLAPAHVESWLFAHLQDSCHYPYLLTFWR